MRKLIAVFSLAVVLFCYAEEQSADTAKTSDVADIAAKLAEAEIRIETLEKEAKQLRQEVDKLNELTTKLSRALRDLELYTKPAASIKPEMGVWESIKRGMTAEETKDLLGNPEEITQLRVGGEIWYYYGLGSITFDRGGRVSSQRTFKQLPIEHKVR